MIWLVLCLWAVAGWVINWLTGRVFKLEKRLEGVEEVVKGLESCVQRLDATSLPRASWLQPGDDMDVCRGTMGTDGNCTECGLPTHLLVCGRPLGGAEEPKP